jgi:phenylacetate-coenzyme A ligase PaaK-like adenylate-forming protein
MFFIYKTVARLKYNLIKLVLRIVPSELLEKISRPRVVLVARLIIKKVPAYKEFLKEQKINHEKIRTLIDFKTLPIMDKKNYFFKYGIEKTLLGKSLCDGYNWEQSSNYDLETGFTFWPRFFEDEKMCLTNFDFLLRYYYGCDKKKTLVVVTFVLGMWAAGERISKFAKQLVSKEGIKISVASIGPFRMIITDLIKKNRQVIRSNNFSWQSVFSQESY